MGDAVDGLATSVAGLLVMGEVVLVDGLPVLGACVTGLSVVGDIVVGATALVGLGVELPVVGAALGFLGTKTGADKTGLVCVGPEVKDTFLEGAVVETAVFGINNVGIPVIEGVGIWGAGEVVVGLPVVRVLLRYIVSAPVNPAKASTKSDMSSSVGRKGRESD